MNKFKVNQQVKCMTNVYSDLTEGKTYTIVSLGGLNRIKLVDDNIRTFYFHEGNFEAISISKQLLNVGCNMQEMHKQDKVSLALNETIRHAINLAKKLEKQKPWQLPEIVKNVIESVVLNHVNALQGGEAYVGQVFTDSEQTELRLYLYMRRWKKEFDDVEIKWIEKGSNKYYIYFSTQSLMYYVGRTISMKNGLVIYFSSRDKAEECLKWLKDIELVK